MTRISRTMLALALLLVLGGWDRAHAQVIKTRELLLQNAVVATGGGTALNVDTFNSVALEVTIATTATVQFEGSVRGAVWTPIACQAVGATTEVWVTSATATGAFKCNVAGLMAVRANVSAWTSGAVSVFARATTAVTTR